MLTTAFTLAILTTVGFFLIYRKLPRRVRRFLEKYSLFTDAISLLLTYILLGGTVTALIASALVGILTSILLYIANNPSQFTYLGDLADFLREKLAELKKRLSEIGESYRRGRLLQTEASKGK